MEAIPMSDTTRLTDQQLDAIEATYTESRVSTHYQGCEVDHPFCAVRMLAVEVQALNAERDRLLHIIADMDCRCGPYPELDKAWCQRCAALLDD